MTIFQKQNKELSRKTKQTNKQTNRQKNKTKNKERKKEKFMWLIRSINTFLQFIDIERSHLIKHKIKLASKTISLSIQR